MTTVKASHLPVFTPNRCEQGNSVAITPDSIWCVSEDTTYQYDTMSIAVPVKGGVVRGVPVGVTQVTFGTSVIVEIQE